MLSLIHIFRNPFTSVKPPFGRLSPLHIPFRLMSSTAPNPTSLKPHEFLAIEKPVPPVMFKEKGSKFIGYAHPVKNEADVKIALDSIKAEHPRATHHCYAYRIGPKGENHRANDDGEPSGSAGLPIFNQLQASALTNTLVTVVRYFGGTKLGVSGLIKAYKESAKLTLDDANIIICEPECPLIIRFTEYRFQNVMFGLFSKTNSQIMSFDCDDDGTVIQVVIKQSQKDDIISQLNSLGSDDIQWVFDEESHDNNTDVHTQHDI